MPSTPQNASKGTRQQRQPRKAAAPPKDEYGRLQPQAVELEQAVLGALLVERDAYYQVSEILKPESFYDQRHRIIYETIQRLNLEEKPVDILTVSNALEAKNQLEEVGGRFYIAQLSGMMVSSAHLEYHARIVAQKATARDLIAYTADIQARAFDATQDVDELMQDAEGKLFELSQSNLKKDYTQIDPVIKDSYEMLRKAAARSDGMSGIPSGFHVLDKITAGWQNSDLIILAARPAMGKTAFALSMAKNIAVDQQIPVAFFSLEMANVQLVNRILMNVSGITGGTLKTGNLKDYEWKILDQKMKDLLGTPLYVDDTPSLSVYELRTKARRLVREHGVKLIMIDYLQLMNASGMSFGGRQEEVSTISRSLKGLAKELNIPIIALSQLNRNVESRVMQQKTEGSAAQRPQLSDLRESGAIEQDADMVLFIHRPEYYKIYEDENGHDMRGKAEVIIAKHRNGAVGTVVLTFRGEYARFQNVEDDDLNVLPGSSGEAGSALLESHASVQGELPPAGFDENFPPFTGDISFPPPSTGDAPF